MRKSFIKNHFFTPIFVFIDESNIRSVRKNGKKTIIERIQGDPITVDLDYDKVNLLVKEI